MTPRIVTGVRPRDSRSNERPLIADGEFSRRIGSSSYRITLHEDKYRYHKCRTASSPNFMPAGTLAYVESEAKCWL